MSSEIKNKNYFRVHHKNMRKHNPHFKPMFSNISLQFVTSNQISSYRKLSLPHTSSIYLFFLRLKMQRKLKLTKAYLKRNGP